MTQSFVDLLVCVGQRLRYAARDVNKRSLLAEAEAACKHEDHAQAFADVSSDAEHVIEAYAGHDCSDLRDATTGGLRTDVLDASHCTSSEEHAAENPKPEVRALLDFELVDLEH